MLAAKTISTEVEVYVAIIVFAILVFWGAFIISYIKKFKPRVQASPSEDPETPNNEVYEYWIHEPKTILFQSVTVKDLDSSNNSRIDYSEIQSCV